MHLPSSPVRIAWEPPRSQPEVLCVPMDTHELPTRASLRRLRLDTPPFRKRRGATLSTSLGVIAVLAAGAAVLAPASAHYESERLASQTSVETQNVKAGIGTAMMIKRVGFTSKPAPSVIMPQANTVDDVGMNHPVAQKRVTSPFGLRINPLTGAPGQLHLGQDYGVACGTPVYAAGAGIVTRSAWAQWSGKRIDIDHGNGVKTGYSHNSQLVAQLGQRVKRGQLVAYSGTTGNSTGCHVHFETIRGDSFINPSSVVGHIPGQQRSGTPSITEAGYSSKWGAGWTEQR